MTFETALRLTEILLALALIQQSAEHLRGPPIEKALFSLRLGLCLVLLMGLASPWAVWGLFAIGILLLHRFQGPYNGGADKMAMLILFCLSLVYLAPNPFWADLALAYLAIQLVLSYAVSGWVKLRDADWRRGTALADVFRFSAYPVSESLRQWGARPVMMQCASWAVITLEVAFPATVLHPWTLIAALCATAAFHICNACVFGLNRFLWIWLAAYPSLIWFQARVILT